jgi:hypothetical protein
MDNHQQVLRPVGVKLGRLHPDQQPPPAPPSIIFHGNNISLITTTTTTTVCNKIFLKNPNLSPVSFQARKC